LNVAGGGYLPTGFANIDRRSFELAAMASCAVLGALAVWLLVRLVWLLVPRGDAALGDASLRVGVGDQGPARVQSISKWHLFGNTPLAGSGSGSQATLLAMILRGTLADRDPASGIAVIGDGERGERAYRAGEDVAGGVKLARVYPDHVILLHDGVEETMKLTRDQNLAPADIVRPGQAGNAATRSNGTANATSSSAAAPGAAQTTRVPPDVQQTIERLRQNPEELAKRVQIVPVIDGGRLTGVRVSAGTDMALMGRLGIRAGDIVTAVNGAPVDSLARGQQIIESLRTAASARVTVLRDGKPTDITISLK
jgi:general secretion pathway protein C